MVTSGGESLSQLPSSSSQGPRTSTPNSSQAHQENSGQQNANVASSTPRPNQRGFARRALASVKVVRADLDPQGKPNNFQLHNHTVHVNIYQEEQACVTYILSKIREEMQMEDLVLVGTSGLVLYDQEGTRGMQNWILKETKTFYQ